MATPDSKVMALTYTLRKGTKKAFSNDNESYNTKGTTVYLFEHQIEALKDLSGDGSYNSLLRNILTEYLSESEIEGRFREEITTYVLEDIYRQTDDKETRRAVKTVEKELLGGNDGR